MHNESVRSAVRAIIIQDGKLLLCRYTGATGAYYVCPGGGQHCCENMPAALVRECKEEIGCDIAVGNLAFVTDAIFHTANDNTAPKRHQAEHHFVCAITSGTAHIGARPDIDFVSLEWVPIGQLDSIRLYPAALAGCITPDGTAAGSVYLGTSG